MAGPRCRPDPADSPPSIRLLPLTTPPEPDRGVGGVATRPECVCFALRRRRIRCTRGLGGNLRTGNPDDDRSVQFEFAIDNFNRRNLDLMVNFLPNTKRPSMSVPVVSSRNTVIPST